MGPSLVESIKEVAAKHGADLTDQQAALFAERLKSACSTFPLNDRELSVFQRRAIFDDAIDLVLPS